ncbi:MAG: repressor LexA [Gammaproteobacteria bacterium CG11_big_fil_rev_8_21_14_0_20_46_22]|nr:MAG: repressor LexA [Gammaproteobacteria bacterium CG12_big_fil_rev_8_21_14_0_65_46_12]PIR10795.1 MAG: repressor LexA [Gammaproteobacteria bacterium CG11_big_fil_rev_8_21_14_0_20_46_22]
MKTPRMRDTLSFIKDYIKLHDYAPTVAEIARGLGLKSTGVTHRYIKQLEEVGMLRLVEGKRRNIELSEPEKDENFCLPLLGKIAAGRPIEAIPGIETIDLARTLLGDDRYILKVSGDSMIEEGIFDGDLVVCVHSNTAKNGDVVVALVDEESATLKRFYQPSKNKIVLQPANADHAAMEFEAQRIKIQGIMIGLLRIAA